jgi:hypothetical protein
MASIFKSSAVASATYGTPEVSGLIVTSFSVSETTSPTEFKDDQGSVIAVAVPEPIQQLTIEGMRTGSFTATVGATLAVTMPSSVSLGLTTIVTGLTTNFAAEQFETVSLTANSYTVSMTAS